MDYSLFRNLLQVVHGHGIETFFIAPGSRSAHLTLAVVRSGLFKTRVVTDERSMGYQALGHAVASGKPVGLICTSGTAALNLAPAVAEAFFQRVPLLVFTADRLVEWAGQQDGQTIYQQNLYGPHVKRAYTLPHGANEQHVWHANRILNEAMVIAQKMPAGPIHINVPLAEPRYNELNFVENKTAARIIKHHSRPSIADKYVHHTFANAWLEAERKLIVVGQIPKHLDLCNALYATGHYGQVPVLTEITSQGHAIKESVGHGDLFMPALHAEQKVAMQPDLLLTVGGALLSKNVKQFLREHPAVQHWHLGDGEALVDTFMSVTEWLDFEPVGFITKLGEQNYFNEPKPAQKAYYEAWKAASANTASFSKANGWAAWQELDIVHRIMAGLPAGCDLHLGNSMPVRYANFVGVGAAFNGEVFSNRGTSGIDGCMSAAVGAALARPDRLAVLLLGDSSFFYDRNALWHNDLPANLRVIVLNNAGGNIFRMLPGAAQQEELKEFFETDQPFAARETALQHGLSYAAAHSFAELEKGLEGLTDESKKASLLEIFTDPVANAAGFGEFKQGLKAHFLANYGTGD